MDPTQSLVITVFVAVASLALVIQAGVFLAIYRTTRTLNQKVAAVLPKVENLLETSQKTVEEGRKQMSEITAKTGEILESTRRQLAALESVVTEASEKARVQLERAELVLDDAMSRTHETFAVVHNGVMKPLREINAVAAGIRTAIRYFMTGSRSTVAQATHDEEMFI